MKNTNSSPWFSHTGMACVVIPGVVVVGFAVRGIIAIIGHPIMWFDAVAILFLYLVFTAIFTGLIVAPVLYYVIWGIAWLCNRLFEMEARQS